MGIIDLSTTGAKPRPLVTVATSNIKQNGRLMFCGDSGYDI